jgi:hypothetical protein
VIQLSSGQAVVEKLQICLEFGFQTVLDIRAVIDGDVDASERK